MNILYVVFIFLVFVCAMPLSALIAVVIVLTSGLPIIYTQKRVGLRGKPFFIYKFRTMRLDAEKMQAGLRGKNEAHGPVFKIHNDPRFTPVGRFLAHTGLDEIPQLINIIRGEMTLIGPRPLPIAEAAKLKLWQKKRHDIKPGIISPAILTGRYHEDFDAWMKSDVVYVKQKSFWYDMMLFFRACGFLVRLFAREIGF
jgi:lipopolysaccharide/colanic/teichoic acid biosynthesis glycosyltransferase